MQVDGRQVRFKQFHSEELAIQGKLLQEQRRQQGLPLLPIKELKRVLGAERKPGSGTWVRAV